MTTIHVQRIGDKVLLLHDKLEELVRLARQSQKIDLQLHEDDISALGLMKLAEQSGSFDFWKEKGEDIYSLQDGDPV